MRILLTGATGFAGSWLAEALLEQGGHELAGLSLSGQPDRSGFIARFTGADRHVVDYLGEQVLAAQPAAVRDFLLRTSVLNRLCGPLCDAVLAGDRDLRTPAATADHSRRMRPTSMSRFMTQ